jgi:small conductance mechanosensitive channel
MARAGRGKNYFTPLTRRPATKAMPNWIEDFINQHQILARLIYAAVIFLTGVIASRLARRWLAPILDRSRIGSDLLLKNFFLRALSISIIILTTLAALRQIGWDVQSFIAGLGITGIILGFAFKDTLSNFAAGLLLLIYRPFRAGHVIEVEGSLGTVREMTIVNTEMTTNDGIRVILPNSKVWGAKIINYSLSERRRLEMTMKVRDEDVGEAIRVIKSALAEDGRVLQSPPPSVRVSSITNNSASLVVWAWTDPKDFDAVSADEYLTIQNSLRDHDLPVL